MKIITAGQRSRAASLLALLTLSSCAWLDSVERKLIGEDDPRASAPSNSKRPQMVPKAQYDELLTRFEDMKRENEALKDGRPSSNPLLNDLQNAPVITNQGVKSAAQGETVDVFAGQAGAVAPTVAVQHADPGDIEAQLMNYRQALSMKTQNQGEAMKMFTSLAHNGTPAIKVRAQYQMGEILMQQGEFDLAMQAFDEIISRQAHSGVVLDALRNSVVCADKLGMKQKGDQYRSLLRDVFQVGT